MRDNARGVALHVVDVLTDEFRMLLDRVAHPASDAASRPEQEQEVHGLLSKHLLPWIVQHLWGRTRFFNGH